jgi:PII-like signaling protein
LPDATILRGRDGLRETFEPAEQHGEICLRLSEDLPIIIEIDVQREKIKCPFQRKLRRR